MKAKTSYEEKAYAGHARTIQFSKSTLGQTQILAGPATHVNCRPRGTTELLPGDNTLLDKETRVKTKVIKAPEVLSIRDPRSVTTLGALPYMFLNIILYFEFFGLVHDSLFFLSIKNK